MKKALLQTEEGRILIAGVILLVTCLSLLSVGSFWKGVDNQLLLGISATNAVFGRAAGLSLGYAGELPNWLVITTNGLIETIQVMLVYPLFVLSWNSLLEIKALSKFMRKTREAAARHESKIQRFGIPGLFVFVWIPFWMTGPVIGSVVGYFLGLRPWVNLIVVLSGTWLAILGWALLLRHFHEQTKAFGNYVPFAIIIAILVFALVARTLGRFLPWGNKPPRE